MPYRLNRRSDEELKREAAQIREQLVRAGVAKKIQKDEEFRQKKQKARSEMSKTYYAGIGSRSTPEDILVLMEQLGNRLREDGLILRSGHAPGADQAFERGAGSQAQIFLPWRTFEQDAAFVATNDPETGDVVDPMITDDPAEDAFHYARKIHPAWDSLSQGAQKLHARNIHQILGPNLARPTPVAFVLCWTPGGITSGGTATAIVAAEEREIPVYNLANVDTYDMAFEWAWGEG